MKRYNILITILVIVIIFAIVIWSPWVTRDFALKNLKQKVFSQRMNFNESCRMDITEFNKTFLGVSTRAFLLCDLSPDVFPVEESFFISLMGTVYERNDL
ncbi:MAG: hypothetical protein M3Q63_01095 [bacterium]|nr:hypothetical protein [bacterium]